MQFMALIVWVLLCNKALGLKVILSLSSLDQVHPPLMYSLLDRVSELKETQPGSIQPFSARPTEVSVPESAVEVSCILMSSLVFTLCGTLLQLWHC